MRRWWIVAGLLALALVWLIPNDSANAAGMTTTQKLESIRRYMEQGQGKYVAGDYAAAAKQFEAGYTKHPYSAFLFNAGVCYQKLDDKPKALEKFKQYLSVDPSAPDADKVRERIAALEAAMGQAPPPVSDAGVEDAGDADAGDAGVPAEAGAPTPPTAVPVDDQDAMRSLVVVETEPSGAPVKLYARTQDTAPEFKVGEANPGWQEVFNGRAPAEVALAVGRYHIVIEKFRDFNISQTAIDVSPGHVHHFKANLSQGAFMAFLRLSANVRGAYIYLDDKKKAKPEWGTTPYGELVSAGDHEVLVEAPGFQPLFTKVRVNHGEQKELEVTLKRVDYGYVRIDANAPDIRVAIDEKPVGVWRSGEEPLEVQAASGKHKLTVESDGRKTFEGLINVPKGQILPVHANLIPKYPRGAAWTQAVIGAVVIGAAIYVGNESNKLYDDLEADRKAGVLEEGDERITRGRIFAISADAGFVVGGVLGVLSVYNFIKDPLPESDIKQDKAVEFRDPKKARPTARALFPSRVVWRDRKRDRDTAAARFHITPSISDNSGFLMIGGSF
ncbi:MAG: PEGA domain-containing protein [Polyangiaceae bacterium]|nr:PEGA domain-containing protein [Myxococcales bacterium]MCB9589544.1 PEGA domain-containing protein [Polyangiaceae bacterium]MCB9609172.1 PEGA domain-containing protein [Polyangiaceae bacterium]